MPAIGHPTSATNMVDVSIVMPCLNEVDCLPACFANTGEALALMHSCCAPRR